MLSPITILTMYRRNEVIFSDSHIEIKLKYKGNDINLGFIFINPGNLEDVLNKSSLMICKFHSEIKDIISKETREAVDNLNHNKELYDKYKSEKKYLKNCYICNETLNGHITYNLIEKTYKVCFDCGKYTFQKFDDSYF